MARLLCMDNMFLSCGAFTVTFTPKVLVSIPLAGVPLEVLQASDKDVKSLKIQMCIQMGAKLIKSLDK